MGQIFAPGTVSSGFIDEQPDSDAVEIVES